MSEPRIPTNAELELNKEIALKVGWRVYLYEVHGQRCAQLFKPGAIWVKTYWQRDYINCEIAAWMNAPQYTTDWNAFMELIGDVPYFNTGYSVFDTQEPFWFSWDNHTKPQRGTTRLIAACKAWLQYEQEQQS